MQVENENKPVSRKKFFSWGLGALSVLTAAKFLFGSTPKKTGNTVKMLTQDGKLVEIDQSVLDAASKKQKSTNEEIYNWMKNPSKSNS